MTIRPDRPIVPRYDSEPTKETSIDKLIEVVARAIHTGLGDISVSGSRHAARAAIAAIEASGTHRVVPVEPTEAMLKALFPYAMPEQGYKRLLAAAPRVTK